MLRFHWECAHVCLNVLSICMNTQNLQHQEINSLHCLSKDKVETHESLYYWFWDLHCQVLTNKVISWNPTSFGLWFVTVFMQQNITLKDRIKLIRNSVKAVAKLPDIVQYIRGRCVGIGERNSNGYVFFL